LLPLPLATITAAVAAAACADGVAWVRAALVHDLVDPERVNFTNPAGSK